MMTMLWVGLGFGEDDKKNKKGKKGSSSASPCCQVENCTADMSDAKRYHRRHKVCENHAKLLLFVLLVSNNVFASNVAGSMKYQSLMKPKGVAVGVWLDTTNAAGKVQLSYTREKALTNQKDIVSSYS
ncbi:hypothetical protein LWI29_024578 [Acer saccharum]|uniref:SBP-type domain-containing protein n=1 Tax=Acer saccharum TaxID=4024 RepID=A0AA39RRB6_ACESA|nr:hypothetical protein LWI29_024578 [Acer saccharum]